MTVEEVWGVPAHPLFVHVPVVLLPVIAIGACAMALRPEWRRRYALHLPIAALVVAVATLLAVKSGEPLKDALQPALGTRIDRHADLGDQTALLATLFFLAAAVTASGDWWLRRRAAEVANAVPGRLVTAAAVTAAALGVLAAIWAIRTGHEGARVTWSGVDVGGGE